VRRFLVNGNGDCVILLASNVNIQKPETSSVFTDDYPIGVPKNVKYLEVWIDDKLDCTEHIQYKK